jgi:hypothetical protein
LEDEAACALPASAEAAAALVAEPGVVWVKVQALGRMPAALADAVASLSAGNEGSKGALQLVVFSNSFERMPDRCWSTQCSLPQQVVSPAVVPPGSAY